MPEVTSEDLERLDQELINKYAARFRALKEKEAPPPVSPEAVTKPPEVLAPPVTAPPETAPAKIEKKPTGMVLTQAEIDEQFARMKPVPEPVPKPAEVEPQVQAAEVLPQAVAEPGESEVEAPAPKISETKAEEPEAEPVEVEPEKVESEAPKAEAEQVKAEALAEETKVPETEPERRSFWRRLFKRSEKPAEELAKEIKPEEVDKTLETVVKVDAKAEFQKELEQANLTAQERESFEAILKNKNWFDKASEAIREKVKYHKIAGIGMDAVVGFVGGAGARWAVRNSLKTFFGLGSGAAVGAIVGGSFRGYREWRRAAAEQYSAASWLKELETKSNLELADQHNVLYRALGDKKVKGDEKEALQYVLKLRDIETKLKASREAMPQKGLKEQAKEEFRNDLERLLENRGNTLAVTAMEGKRKDLYLELLSMRKKEIRKKVAKGVAIGAVVGGVGGAIGSWLGGYLHEHFSAGAGEVREAAQAVRAPTQEAVKEALEERSQAMLAVVENAARNLPNEDFVMQAKPGEGLTHIARGLIHDYLVEQHQFDPGRKLGLAPEQLVYAEDFLRRYLEDRVQPGELFRIKGNQIIEAISRAQSLTQGQLENLRENWIGKISENTWQQILDYEQVFNAANNFAVQAKQEAVARAEELGRNVMENLNQVPGLTAGRVQELAREAVAEAAKTESKNKTLSYILGGLGVAGVVGAGVAARFVFRKYARRPSAEVLGFSRTTTQEEPKAAEEPKAEELKPEAGPVPASETLPKETEVDLDKISSNLEQKYGIIPVISGGQYMSENVSALQKIDEVLGGLSEEEKKKLRGVGFEIGEENKVSDMGWFEIDFSKKPEELKKFIQQNLPEVERIGKVKQQSQNMKLELDNLHSTQILSHVYGDNELKGLRRLKEALLGKKFDRNIEINLVPPGGSLWFKKGINLVSNWSVGRMKAEIEKYLTPQKEHKPA